MKQLLFGLYFLTIANGVSAAPADVNSTHWYYDVVQEFSQNGFISSQDLFRASDSATRGEFAELIVNAKGGIATVGNGQPSFNDTPADHPEFQYIEEAARQGWIKGSGDCYGTRPCQVFPDSSINRAEAAVMLVRAFGISRHGSYPSFSDNDPTQWFADPITVVASRCILRGDSGTPMVRPGDTMNRAEMVVMVKRSLSELYYPTCDSTNDSAQQTSNDKQVVSPSAGNVTKIKVPFEPDFTRIEEAAELSAKVSKLGNQVAALGFEFEKEFDEISSQLEHVKQALKHPASLDENEYQVVLEKAENAIGFYNESTIFFETSYQSERLTAIQFAMSDVAESYSGNAAIKLEEISQQAFVTSRQYSETVDKYRSNGDEVFLNEALMIEDDFNELISKYQSWMLATSSDYPYCSRVDSLLDDLFDDIDLVAFHEDVKSQFYCD